MITLVKTKMSICEKHGYTVFGYYQNRFRCKKCISDNVSDRRTLIKERLVEYKGGKCEKCGYDNCITALEFHHLDPSIKSFVLNKGSFNQSYERLKKEADKCILVCANCHREIHYEEILRKRMEYEEYKKQNIENYKIDELNECRKHRDVMYKLKLENVKNDIESKMKQKDIAMKYGVSLATLKRFMEKNNLIKHHIILDKKLIIDTYRKHLEITTTAKDLGVTRKVLLKRINDMCLTDTLNAIRKEHNLLLNSFKNI